MRFHALATDYDGTIAHDGAVDADTLAALERARKSGRKLILVSGRELPDLQSVFDRFDLFDLAVLENGAIVYNPQTKETRVLSEPPPPHFAEQLRARGVTPVSTGHVIVATFQPHQDTVLRTIQDLGLELQVIFNKDAVMVLPSGVNKATGLTAALADLGLSPHNAVGVGDAENDHAFLRLCECSAAVANALPAVKDTADVVLKGKRGAGVAELIDRLIADDLSDLKTLSRHRVPLGEADAPGEGIDPAGAGVLVCGTSGSGKSTLTTAVMERLADAGYQLLIVDPEGDYTNLEFATVLGNTDHAPRPEDVTDALRDPKRSLVVNLLGVPLADRPKFFAQLLPRVLEVKARTGRPHWLVVDEAHHLLPAGPDAANLAGQLPDRGTLYITVHPGAVEPAALAHVGTLLVIGGHPVKTVGEFCKAVGEGKPKCPAVKGDRLPTGDALVWRRGAAEAVVVKTKPPRTERKRHSRKYAEGNLGPDRSFFFRGPEGKLNLKASNLHLFVQLADGVDDDTWEFHRKAGDYSKWVRGQIKDNALADELAEVEADEESAPAETRAAVRAAVEGRYTLPADVPSGQID
ncbi:MAG: phosphoglycolate phosphatase [Isosphaera sp.]|nr:phosphoglycolate phosphatase [Isosphaera sp.]